MLLNLANYLLFFITDIVLLLLAGFVYIRLTPYNEIALIRAGNTAAAIALGGAMLGYACVVYSATAHGSSIFQTIFWSLISLVVQIGAFELLSFIIRDDWKLQMERGDIAHGVALGSFSLAVGILNAGCLTP